MPTGDYMSDLSTAMNVSAAQAVKLRHSDNKDRTSLSMDDFMNLMVVTLKNQTLDNTTDMSQMMNQMVQMSVMQALSDISSLVEDSTSLNYAAGLVGKEVTIGTWQGDRLVEFTGTVTGTGTLNGQQVVFLDDGEQAYTLNSILAIGKLPEKIIAPGQTPAEDTTKTESATGTKKPDETGKTDESGETGETGETEETGETQETGTGTGAGTETGTGTGAEPAAYKGESGYDT